MSGLSAILFGSWYVLLERGYQIPESVVMIYWMKLWIILIAWLCLQKMRYCGSTFLYRGIFLLSGIGLLIQFSIEGHGPVDPAPDIYRLFIFAITMSFFGISIVYLMNRLYWFKKRTFLVAVVILFAFVGIVIWNTISGGKQFFHFMTPWEVIKVVVVLITAKLLSEWEADSCSVINTSDTPIGIWVLPLCFVCLIMSTLILSIRDFGQFLIYGVYFCMLLVSMRVWRLRLLGLGAIAGVLYIKLAGMPVNLSEWNAMIEQRLLIWTDFWDGCTHIDTASGIMGDQIYQEWRSSRWQLLQGLIAVREGGFWGAGFNLGYPNIVPLAQSDFIYNALAEELGLIGCVAVVLLYLVLILRIFSAASANNNTFGQMVCLCAGIMFFAQVFVNVGGVLQILPLTGVTLPFISAGGFSYLTNLSLLGIVMLCTHWQSLSECSKVDGTSDMLGYAHSMRDIRKNHGIYSCL